MVRKHPEGLHCSPFRWCQLQRSHSILEQFQNCCPHYSENCIGKYKRYPLTQKHFSGVAQWPADQIVFQVLRCVIVKLSRVSLSKKAQLYKLPWVNWYLRNQSRCCFSQTNPIKLLLYPDRFWSQASWAALFFRYFNSEQSCQHLFLKLCWIFSSLT